MGGQRVAKVPKGGGGKKKIWIVAGSAAGVLLIGYLGLCAWSSYMQTILPNVTVGGIDVSGMDRQQAQEIIDQALRDRAGELSYELGYESWERSVTGDQIQIDAVQSAQNAWRVGREHFIGQGIHLLAHALGMSGQAELAIAEEDTALSGLVEGLAKDVNDARSSYAIEGERLVMTKGAAAVDWEQALGRARKNIQGAFADLFSGQGPVTLRDTIGTQGPAQSPDFDAIHSELACEPVNAQMDPDTFEVTDHVVGVDFDVEQLKAAYSQAAEGETFSVPLVLTQPKQTREDLEAKLFRDLLGQATTRVSGSSNRKFNVKLSAEACNGAILLPGQEFSYNNTTGSRTPDKGYRNAPTYVAGKSVDDIGGGICQTSSTIYYAVLHTPLEVVERHDHRFNTGYVPLGMDATVYFGSLDFRFRNNTDYPVKIVTSSFDEGGKRYLKVELYGTNTEGLYAKPKSSTFDRVAPTTVYQPDPNVPQGTLVLDREQYAYTGYSAHTWRYIYDKDGNELEKQDMGSSKYSMRPNLYYYNPKDGDPASWPNGRPPQPAAPSSPQGGGDPVVDPEQPVVPVQPELPQPGDVPASEDPPAESGEGGAQSAVQSGTA